MSHQAVKKMWKKKIMPSERCHSEKATYYMIVTV